MFENGNFYGTDRESFYIDRHGRGWVVLPPVWAEILFFATPLYHPTIGYVTTSALDDLDAWGVEIVHLPDARQTEVAGLGVVETWDDVAAVLDAWPEHKSILSEDIHLRVRCYDARSITTVSGARLVVRQGDATVTSEVHPDENWAFAMEFNTVLELVKIDAEIDWVPVLTTVIEPVDGNPPPPDDGIVWIPQIVDRIYPKLGGY